MRPSPTRTKPISKESFPQENNSKENNQVEFASFWQRLMAVFCDYLILAYMPILIIWYLLEAKSVHDLFYKLISTLMLTVLPVLLFGVIYRVWFISQTGSTPGKQVWGVQVRDEDGFLLSPIIVFLREYISKNISAFFVCLGYLWVIKDPQKRGWHDMFSGSRVIKTKNQFGLSWIITLGLILGHIFIIGSSLAKIPEMVEIFQQFLGT